MLYNVPLYKVEERRRGRPGRRMQCGGPAPSWENRGCLQRPGCLLLRLSTPPQMPNNQPQGTRETFQYHLSELHSRAPKCQALVTTDIYRAPGLWDQPSGGCAQGWTGLFPTAHHSWWHMVKSWLLEPRKGEVLLALEPGHLVPSHNTAP